MKRQTFVEYSKVIAISLGIFLVTAIFSVVQFYFFEGNAKYTSVGNANSSEKRVVIIDPGHGGEDGGAVGISGVLEKDLNLMIAFEVKHFLDISGIDAVMTRETDRMLYNEGQQNRKKFFDVRNRVELAEKYENPVFVSIHQNKFPLEKYSGLQVYYSPNNNDSKPLAESIQNNIKLYLQPDNNRQIKESGKNIYVLKKLECPSVLVECGFLSNSREEQLLCDEQYRRKLAFVIFKSITEYLADG